MMFGVPVVAVVIVCYLFTPVNPNNYLAEINHKLHLLDSVEGRRMIFVGGSNVAFGVDSHAIADSLGMKVINTGLHAGLGLKYQLESVVGNLKEGDVLVIMPEYEQFYDCFWGVGETLGAAIKYSGFRGASNLSIKQWMGVLSAMPSVAYSDYKIKNRVDYRYTSLNFNSLGDEVAHRGKQRCDKVTINPIAGEIDEDAVDFVAGVLRDVKAGGEDCGALQSVIGEGYAV